MRLDGAARLHEVGYTFVHGLGYMGKNDLYNILFDCFRDK